MFRQEPDSRVLKHCIIRVHSILLFLVTTTKVALHTSTLFAIWQTWRFFRIFFIVSNQEYVIPRHFILTTIIVIPDTFILKGSRNFV